MSQAYPDPLTGGAPWTIGIGHTGPNVKPDSIWSDLLIDANYTSDMNAVIDSLNKALPWWSTLSTHRQWAMQSMVFQMGIKGFLKFTNTIQAIKNGRYADAKAGMLASLWARQTPLRANRLANMMETDQIV